MCGRMSLNHALFRGLTQTEQPVILCISLPQSSMCVLWAAVTLASPCRVWSSQSRTFNQQNRQQFSWWSNSTLMCPATDRLFNVDFIICLMVTRSVNCLSVSLYFCTTVQVKRHHKLNCYLSCVWAVHWVDLHMHRPHSTDLVIFILIFFVPVFSLRYRDCQIWLQSSCKYSTYVTRLLMLSSILICNMLSCKKDRHILDGTQQFWAAYWLLSSKPTQKQILVLRGEIPSVLT